MPSAALTFRLTTTSDGHVAMVVLKQSHWDGLITALALEGDASRSPGEILRAARIKIARTTTDAIVELLTAHDVPCTAVVRLEDVASHPQVIANEILVEYDHPLIGPICQPRSTPRFASSLDAEIIPAPGLGEHSRDILAELGFSSNQSEALIVGGTVIQETR
jgi:crotonobetainyl-CoA:carnitine CoA-transferase CaiB-like acyl-CoA transferase